MPNFDHVVGVWGNAPKADDETDKSMRITTRHNGWSDIAVHRYYMT